MNAAAFYQGRSCRAWKLLGSHLETDRWVFRLWAPGARSVSVVGDFNDWKQGVSPMHRRPDGLWECSVGNAWEGQKYKYAVEGAFRGIVLKADPYARKAEPFGTASILFAPAPYPWTDEDYLHHLPNAHKSPMNIYEVHLGSWKKGLSYRQLGDALVPYARDMGYTHLELMPLTEYPYDPSWGYQVTGYFAPTGRYGDPEDLKYLIDKAHQAGLGVLMDWVPAHFTRDEYGLAAFDGGSLYEHPDPRRADMRQWGTLLFDYGRPEVQSFLISSAVYWLEEYHLDGLRVDAVSCMLYMDFGREGGDYLPNIHGGREDLGAISLFKKLSSAVHALPDRKLLIAEESTAFPMVTNKHGAESLGFDFKWNMGWMNDMLSYMELDPIARKWHHDKLTFSLTYAFSEYYLLPFSHDEVVHGKRSMLNKMPGDYNGKFAQLRLLYTYLMAHPGKKLTFMGMELGQFIEWRFGESLDWLLLEYPQHKALQGFVRGLNWFYKEHPALWNRDDGWDGFAWCSVDDKDLSVVSFLRRSEEETLLCAFNFTPVERPAYTMGIPLAGGYAPVFSTNPLPEAGGLYRTHPVPAMGHEYSLTVPLPPFGGVFFRLEEGVPSSVPSPSEDTVS